MRRLVLALVTLLAACAAPHHPACAPGLERWTMSELYLGLARPTGGAVSEAEFHARPELIRTLNVRPPVVEGRVRIVTIAGFDAQACGGTHVHSTAEIGPARLIRVDNKGRDNTRFYWTLTP